MFIDNLLLYFRLNAYVAFLVFSERYAFYYCRQIISTSTRKQFGIILKRKLLIHPNNAVLFVRQHWSHCEEYAHHIALLAVAPCDHSVEK